MSNEIVPSSDPYNILFLIVQTLAEHGEEAIMGKLPESLRDVTVPMCLRGFDENNLFGYYEGGYLMHRGLEGYFWQRLSQGLVPAHPPLDTGRACIVRNCPTDSRRKYKFLEVLATSGRGRSGSVPSTIVSSAA